MSDITINYKGNAIATMDASGTKTLLTDGKYCEDDIDVVYVKPSGGGGNSPLVISSVTVSESERTFTVALPKVPTNFVITFEADASTLTSIYAMTTTTYQVISGICFYPVGDVDSGSTTSHKYNCYRRYRPSTKAFSAQSEITLSISGTTLTVSCDSSTRFAVGTWLVKVWEVATS